MISNAIGIIFEFIGIIVLIIHAKKTKGAMTQADEDYFISPWVQKIGYILIGVGFIFLIIGNAIK